MQSPNVIPAARRARLMLVTLALAAAGVCTSIAQAQPAAGEREGAGRHHMRGGPMGMHGPMGGRMLERALDSVNATPEQRTRIRDIMKAAANDLRNQREASRGLREQLMTLFAQPTVDARAVESLRQQMVQQHDQSSRRQTQALLDASAVLTPEQRQQLAERMKQRGEMMERHQRERRALDPK